MRYQISAHNEVSGERMDLFVWTRSPEAGIARAKKDAKNFQMDGILSDYRATPLADAATKPKKY